MRTLSLTVFTISLQNKLSFYAIRGTVSGDHTKTSILENQFNPGKMDS